MLPALNHTLSAFGGGSTGSDFLGRHCDERARCDRRNRRCGGRRRCLGRQYPGSVCGPARAGRLRLQQLPVGHPRRPLLVAPPHFREASPSTTAIRSIRSSPSIRTRWTATCRSSFPAAWPFTTAPSCDRRYEPPVGVQLCPLPGSRPDPRLQGTPGHAEHRGRRGSPSPHGTGVQRAGVGARIDVREEASRRESERGRGEGRLRLRSRPFHAALQAAARRPMPDGPS